MGLSQMTEGELAQSMAIIDNIASIGFQVISKLHQLKGQAVDTDNLGAKEVVEYAQSTPFTFFGNDTDLSIFWENETFSFELFDNLDTELRNSIIETFSNFENQGIVKINQAERTIQITPLGREKAYDIDFIINRVTLNQERILAVKEILSNGDINYNDINISNENELADFISDNKSSVQEYRINEDGIYQAKVNEEWKSVWKQGNKMYTSSGSAIEGNLKKTYLNNVDVELFKKYITTDLSKTVGADVGKKAVDVVFSKATNANIATKVIYEAVNVMKKLAEQTKERGI